MLKDEKQAAAYETIEKAIGFIEENFRSQPSLDEMAANVHLSKYHFGRLFKQWAGISPGRFLQSITLAYTKRKLAESRTLLDTALASGLSGPGRLHDLFVNFDAVTPGEFKKQGAGLKIDYGFCPTPFGECLLATTPRGICHLGFVTEGGRNAALDSLFGAWPHARFSQDTATLAPVCHGIFTPGKAGPFKLWVKGTNFQVNVWRALVHIPRGHVVSYQGLAESMGRPKAFRAVASAVAANPIGYLIPCHRVISKSGKIHQYRWGPSRKKAMVGWEDAQAFGHSPHRSGFPQNP